MGMSGVGAFFDGFSQAYDTVGRVSRDADECWRLDNEPTLYKTLPEAQRAAERRLENIL